MLQKLSLGYYPPPAPPHPFSGQQNHVFICGSVTFLCWTNPSPVAAAIDSNIVAAIIHSPSLIEKDNSSNVATIIANPSQVQSQPTTGSKPNPPQKANPTHHRKQTQPTTESKPNPTQEENPTHHRKQTQPTTESKPNPTQEENPTQHRKKTKPTTGNKPNPPQKANPTQHRKKIQPTTERKPNPLQEENSTHHSVTVSLFIIYFRSSVSWNLRSLVSAFHSQVQEIERENNNSVVEGLKTLKSVHTKLHDHESQGTTLKGRLDGECDKFSAEVNCLYSCTCLEYLETWLRPLEDVSCFTWITK